MAETYNFRKLSEVEQLETVPENANAIVEVDGEIKRVAGGGLGGSGGGGVLTVTIVTDGTSCQCDDTTFAELKAALDSHKPMLVSIYHSDQLYYATNVFKQGESQIWIFYPENENGIWWYESDKIIQGISI